MRVLALVLGFGLAFGSSVSHMALAQEISGNFVGGSVRVGDDTGTCNAGRYGAIRFNTNKFQGCSTGGWVDIGTFGGGGGADNLGNHVATQNIVSDTHNTDDLGTTAIRWKDGWFAGTVTGGTFAGSGASLTALNATNLASGTVPAARLPAYTGDVTKAAGGTALTLSAGAVDLTHMSATGTKNSTTFLRGDNTWAPAGGGAPSCTIRTGAIAGSAATVNCNASETMTGGGCDSSNGGISRAWPSAIRTWRCEGSGSWQAFAICCTF